MVKVEVKEMHAKKESFMEKDFVNGREGNPGWADAMKKILRTKKAKRKKTVVLSKAKKLCDVGIRGNGEALPFTIEGAKGEGKAEDVERTAKREEKLMEGLKERKKDASRIRVKPSILDRERERTLEKIATKGVVQLFNAVKQQQGEIKRKLSEAGALERKREQVLKSMDKNRFLDVLMGGSKSISADNSVKSEERKGATREGKERWNVLREDFVMGAKLKDWDRKEQDEEESSAPEEMDSDD